METGPERRSTDASEGSSARSVLDDVRCPACAARMELQGRTIDCPGCGTEYPRLGSIPILLPDFPTYVASCRRQLRLLADQVERTVQNIRAQLRAPDMLPVTRERCRAMIEAIEGQQADVRAILGPRLPRVDEPEGEAPSEVAPTTLEYLPYLYRDWGWPATEDGENELALAMVERILGEHALGRTLVMGAGACRLAYDLHRAHPEAEIVVIDLDPLLFSAAHAVTHGESVSIREANLEVGELGQDSRRWELSAPHGPVDDDRFHFMVADAMEPPFGPGSFDTVLTPWFIDQGTEDVRDLVSTLQLLLEPGGRWLNLGPLHYDWDVPVGLRFAREELFDLAARAGFRVDRWESTSAPYLVSELNGRGKVEWVLAFAADKLGASDEQSHAGGGPPAWLLFRHLPIPTFPGQSAFWSKAPAVQTVVAAIDGTRTLEDIARLVREQAGQPDLTMGQVRLAVRQCLADVHPEARRAGSA